MNNLIIPDNLTHTIKKYVDNSYYFRFNPRI